MLNNCPSSSPGKLTAGDASFRARSSCSPDTFSPHTHTVHVPRHFQPTHAHSSCSPTPSVHTSTQFMFSDTFNQHAHTVHVPRHPQSTHAHSSCSPTPSVHTRTQFMFPDTLNPHMHTVHVPRHPRSTHSHTVHIPRHFQSTHSHPIIICIPLTSLCRPLLVGHSTDNSACNCTDFTALHSRSSRLPKSFPAPSGVSTGQK